MNNHYATGFRSSASEEWTFFGPFTTPDDAHAYADEHAGHDDGPGVDETTVIVIFPR